MLTVQPGSVDLAELERIWRESLPVCLPAQVRVEMGAAARLVERAASGDEAVYGVNTGFGKLSHIRIPVDQVRQLQRNLILSHCCGVGEEAPVAMVRLIMVLKLLSFGRGASGTSAEVVDLLIEMLARGVTPIVPSQGSVGASGDLAPLAHMTAVLIGEGEAEFKGQRLGGRDGLHRAGLAPVKLGPKEGLAFINGTQFSTACSLTALFGAWRLARTALVTGALSVDAVMGSDTPFLSAIHELRGHRGQIDAAAHLYRLLAGSRIRESHLDGDSRVQDPYCLRCQPQVMGACIDVLRQAGRTLRIEANAATDNPLILVGSEEIVSGGNFHAEPVAFAADQIALAIAEIGSISQRRIAMLVDPTMNYGLPPFLTPHPGLNSGFMIMEVTSAALMAENRHLAAACSIDSTPTSANQEDHVSMSAHAAWRLLRMNRNLAHILAIEWLCAAQAVEMRAPLPSSRGLVAAIAVLRRRVAAVGEDRFMANDMALVTELVEAGEMIGSVEEFSGRLLAEME